MRLLIINNIDLMSYEEEKSLYNILRLQHVEFEVFEKDYERSTKVDE